MKISLLRISKKQIRAGERSRHIIIICFKLDGKINIHVNRKVV